MVVIGHVLMALGGLICLANAYLSFVRYGVHRLRGGIRETYRHVSSVPLVGSVLVAVALIGLWNSMPARIIGLVIMAIDTGGLHWFAISIFVNGVRGKPAEDGKASEEDRL